MKTNTRDLVGKALDYAVTKAMRSDFLYEESTYLLPYSTDREYAEVIIATYNILVHQTGDMWVAAVENLQSLEAVMETGPTREIAAMQCFAVSRLGDAVDVPDNLLFAE